MRAAPTNAVVHETLTPPQREVLSSKSDFIIAQGAIRSGKTDICAMRFIIDTMRHRNCSFIVSGKSIGALKRNVLTHLVKWANVLRQRPEFNRTENRISLGDNNAIYFFGGNNESSQDLVQGLTAAGALIDEATLQPAEYLKQVYGRCSVAGATIINTLNPSSPRHHFKREYIDNADRVGADVIYFDFDSNPGMSVDARDRARRLFSGVFEKRYIQGQWAAAAGAIYPHYTLIDPPDMEKFDSFEVAIDYGAASVTCYLLIGRKRGQHDCVVAEYYYEAARTGHGKTDNELCDDLTHWIDAFGIKPRKLWIDPAAQGFGITLRRAGYPPRKALNDVVPGISILGARLATDRILVSRECQNLIEELDGYVWDEDKQAAGKDEPIKQHDHALDALRYFAYSNYSRNAMQPVDKTRGW